MTRPATWIFPTKFPAALSACEGALLIIDAAQGVEAQTVANVHLAMKQNLTIIPVINKIDLPHADVARPSSNWKTFWRFPARRHSGEREAGHWHRGNS